MMKNSKLGAQTSAWLLCGMLCPLVSCTQSHSQQKAFDTPPQPHMVEALQKHGFSSLLYLDRDGEVTEEFEEGGICIAYDKERPFCFHVAWCTSSNAIEVLYMLGSRGELSYAHVSCTTFLDAEGNFRFDNPPTKEKLFDLKTDSNKATGMSYLTLNNLRDMGTHALDAIRKKGSR